MGIDADIRDTIDNFVKQGKPINAKAVADQVARDLGIEMTPLLKEQSNRACRQWYLRDVRMPYSLQSLRFVGCLQPDALTLALTAWESQEMPVGGPDGKAPSKETQSLFREAYAIACSTLGLPVTEPDLRSVMDRTPEEVEVLITSYRWAGLAQQSQADAMRAELERRKRARH